MGGVLIMNEEKTISLQKRIRKADGGMETAICNSQIGCDKKMLNISIQVFDVESVELNAEEVKASIQMHVQNVFEEARAQGWLVV